MKQFCIIACALYEKIIKEMIESAKSIAVDNQIDITDVFWAPGSLEIPLILTSVLENKNLRKKYSGIIIFGLIKKGKTKHGEILAHQVTNKILGMQLKYKIPMAVSIIGPCSTMNHAKNKANRVAKKAVLVVINMIKELNKIEKLK